MANQSINNKLAEIHYRRLSAKQHTENNKLLENEPDQAEFKQLITPKLKETGKRFQDLQKKGIVLSPYLEIGSEHCLRPMILENQLNANGFAVDISVHSLISAKKYAKIFHFKKLPKIICADAYNLPFKSNSIPFIFIYETLHHFPEPQPVIDEIYRVLSPGGYLLIGGDPIKQQFQLPIWRRPNRLRLWEKFLKAIFVLPFISQIGKTETEYGIIETAFDLKTWRKSLSRFARIEAEIEVFPFGILEKTENKKLDISWPVKTGLFLLGGGIRAVCLKEGKRKVTSGMNILICPNCKKRYKKEFLLVKRAEKLKCNKCKTHYAKFQNVQTILERNLFEKIARNK